MNIEAITGIFSSIPTDWLILGIFALFASFDAVHSGARRICMLALSLPATVLLINSLPDSAVLGSIAGQFSTPVLGAVLFFIVLVIMYVIVGSIGIASGGEAGQTLQAALAGVALSALVVTFWIQIPALDSIWHFGTQVQDIFGESYRFFWLLGSYAAIAFIRNG
jgi:hypothetical protein